MLDRVAATTQSDGLLAIHLLREVGKLFGGGYLDGILPGCAVATTRVCQLIHAI